jgi:cyclopropane fatty-acyl-phospholipid synthase-like methyltransferase
MTRRLAGVSVVDPRAAMVYRLCAAEVDMAKSNPPLTASHYEANYKNFQSNLYAQIRQEAFGEDIGQNSWLTASEQDRFVKWLDLAAGKRLLDVACGAGGPALRIAATTGCSVAGVDVHEDAVTTARVLAAQRGLAARAEFLTADASRPFLFSEASRPFLFSEASFDAITCIDAINHFSDRFGIVAEWARVLKPGGRLLFTDPLTVTGPLTNGEIAARSLSGFYLYVPPGYDERVLSRCGLQLLVCEDATANMATVAQARYSARASRSDAIRAIEGDKAYEGQQEFLAVAARLAREGSLSRFVYVAAKLS